MTDKHKTINITPLAMEKHQRTGRGNKMILILRKKKGRKKKCWKGKTYIQG